MTSVFVIRFAKGVVSTPLYFSPLDGQLAFCPELMKAFGLRTRKECEALLEDILQQVYKVKPELYDKLSDPDSGMSIEEHSFGDHFQ